MTPLLIIFPSVTQRVVDEAIRAQKPMLILPLTLLALASFFFREVLNYIRVLLNSAFEQKVICDLRNDLYEHLQRLPISWFDHKATGDIMTRVLEDVNAVERVIIDGTQQGVIAILQIVAVVILMFHIDGRLASLALISLPLLIASTLVYTSSASNRHRIPRQAASAMNSLLHDNLAGIRELKAYVREEQEHARFRRASRQLSAASLVVVRDWATYAASMSFFNNLGLALVMGFGGMWVIRGDLDLGKLAAFLILTGYLYEPITRLHSLNQLFQAGRAAGERIFEILDAIREPDTGSVTRAPNKISGRIEYKEVEFGYEGDRQAVHGISFVAEPGQTVAFVGPTGSGKSTLTNLLLRFYELHGGRILLDGHPIGELSKRCLRSLVGYVAQESFLFNGTIRENLLLGNPLASEEQIQFAVRTANIKSFIDSLPDGLETNVGERGVKLSVGEKQRISIARAILKNPPILLLDEATASVDTQTECEIQEALNRLLAGRTSFVIAHRLSTIRNADQILVLDKGRIVERGRHKELLALDGKYAQLCRSGLFVEDRGITVAQAVAPQIPLSEGNCV